MKDKETRQKRYQFLKEQGICTNCGKNKTLNGGVRCEECKLKEVTYRINKKKQSNISLNIGELDKICNKCLKRPAVEGCTNCIECKVMYKTKYNKYLKGIICTCKEIKETNKKGCNICLKILGYKESLWRRDRKDKVFQAYGGAKCACCGETETSVLQIDHINNDGASHRRELSEQGISGGDSFYGWLIENNFPLGFQVLCVNCNWSKRIYGVCHHQLQVNQILDLVPYGYLPPVTETPLVPLNSKNSDSRP